MDLRGIASRLRWAARRHGGFNAIQLRSDLGKLVFHAAAPFSPCRLQVRRANMKLDKRETHLLLAGRLLS